MLGFEAERTSVVGEIVGEPKCKHHSLTALE